MRAIGVSMEQRRNERAGGNWRAPRKPADQRHRPARFPNEEVGEWPGRGLNRVRFRREMSRLTALPCGPPFFSLSRESLYTSTQRSPENHETKRVAGVVQIAQRSECRRSTALRTGLYLRAAAASVNGLAVRRGLAISRLVLGVKQACTPQGLSGMASLRGVQDNMLSTGGIHCSKRPSDTYSRHLINMLYPEYSYSLVHTFILFASLFPIQGADSIRLTDAGSANCSGCLRKYVRQDVRGGQLPTFGVCESA
ncbi:hypothetical protein PR048_022432 [Dryococelus australis]|uniref:Uncharacterized protein n=1 Tax=Dryococelus australis TaxID=614101 RepID=A0ABQ9H121_9NEOP|nr:hypothetical protein PR048_022432 [Dryococelus australis]